MSGSLPARSRAEIARANGARSQGPRTAAGKARASMNALAHGLSAQRHVLAQGERQSEFEAFAAALLEELRPETPLQELLTGRLVAAAWRLRRADLIETRLLDGVRGEERSGAEAALTLIRDCNGPRALDTLLRYRGALAAEFWRCLAALRTLAAENGDRATESERTQQVIDL
jgi:hypothetical protein